MIGSIISDQRCEVCGSNFKDDRKTGLYCPNHPDQQPTRYIVKFGRRARRRFKSYEKAYRFLNGLRWEVDTGKFDPREHKASNPLGFKNLYEEWLEEKEGAIAPEQLARYRRWMDDAVSVWGKDRSVKTIQHRDFVKYLKTLKHHRTGKPLSDASKAKVRSCLNSFWNWMQKEAKVLSLAEMPNIPFVSFDYDKKPITDGDTQALILAEMERIESNPLITLAVLFCMVYFQMRPGQLVKVRYRDVDFERGGIYIIRKGKKGDKDPEFVPMLPEHMEMLKALPQGLPDVLVFRLLNGNEFQPGTIGEAWRRVIKSLKKQGLLPQEFNVDFYRGSRTTAISMLEGVSPEEIRQTSRHMNLESFQHYIRWQDDKSRKIFRQTPLAQSGPQVDHINRGSKTKKS